MFSTGFHRKKVRFLIVLRLIIHLLDHLSLLRVLQKLRPVILSRRELFHRRFGIEVRTSFKDFATNGTGSKTLRM
ncbi:hypothetical protein C8J55DRAFT_507694 [Lentinula edodes]|uniref:Uncharacterized protein n=1 Tax=Lentinula lateritia TaxID=40482 RepID=A0A9W9APD7_9AGAR|nr:hypothetical protein C8J55DRAFT_507694 [Lentinula edodes]